jgi:hypothetical protein
LRVTSRARGPRSPDSVAAPSLPTMVAPLVELLRAVVGLRDGDLSVSERVIPLAPGAHQREDHAARMGGSAVETEWTASLHPFTGSGA